MFIYPFRIDLHTLTLRDETGAYVSDLSFINDTFNIPVADKVKTKRFILYNPISQQYQGVKSYRMVGNFEKAKVFSRKCDASRWKNKSMYKNELEIKEVEVTLK